VPALTQSVYAATGAATAALADVGPAEQLATRAVAYVLGK